MTDESGSPERILVPVHTDVSYECSPHRVRDDAVEVRVFGHNVFVDLGRNVSGVTIKRGWLQKAWRDADLLRYRAVAVASGERVPSVFFDTDKRKEGLS